MRRSRTVALGAAAAVVALGIGGAAFTWWPTTEPTTGSPAPADPLKVAPPPGLALPRAREPVPVLGASNGPPVDGSAVRAALRPMLRDRDLGRHTGVIVRDLVRDRTVVSTGGSDPYVPASTLKLFTTAAALSELGPDHRFTTTVLQVGPRAKANGAPGVPTVVLVGGGDPLLSSEPSAARELGVPGTVTVSELATRAARAVLADGVRRVRVGYDTSLFTGAAAAPSWEPDYVADDIVSRVSALWVEEGRENAGLAERSPDPAEAAADVFSQDLEHDGLTVVGAPQVIRPPADAATIAEVAGAPLETVVEHVLQTSDNEGAEVLLRHVALAAGRQPSFAGGVTAVREVLSGLGVPFTGVETYDGSGLSRDNRVTRAALAEVLQLGANPELPDLRTITTGLPVARFSGSLAYRFVSPATADGRGLVRAKTGTLSHVHALAGTLVTRDGTLLGFALVADRVQLVHTLDARELLDEMAARLARCGCGG